MRFTRRQTMGMMASGLLAGLGSSRGLAQPAPATQPGRGGRGRGAGPQFPPLAPPPAIPDGPFKGTRESLQAGYKIPDWYRDAKFGMWAHWGPQSAAEYDDWYARRMYVPGEPQYEYHIKTHGHPSKVGFKDIIQGWKAEKFDADALVQLYKNAGAKFFCSMACHHDNFDLWNSKHQPKWNSVATGPKKDIVALFRDAARKHGLRFAVSDHLSNSFSWFAPAHLSDPTGPLAGVPYDGADPQWADLYHDYSKLPANFAQTAAQMGRVNHQPWVTNYYLRMIDLIDQHQPDLLYTDGGIPYGDYGLNQLAHVYNLSAKRNGGIADAVYTSKSRPDADLGICVLDRERGVADSISPAPWQTDTCIGNWHYHMKIYDESGYKTPKWVVDMLVDIVACNGNLMLNVPLPASGMPDDKEMRVIEGITKWMAVNGEGIYATRPYKIFGAGPVQAPATNRGRFQESSRTALTANHVRYTTKGNVLYAFVMGWPGREAVIPSLATNAAQGVGRIQGVELLGAGRMPFAQDVSSLRVQLPETAPSDHAITFKIMGALT